MSQEERDERVVEVIAQACVWVLLIATVMGAWWAAGGAR